MNTSVENASGITARAVRARTLYLIITALACAAALLLLATIPQTERLLAGGLDSEESAALAALCRRQEALAVLLAGAALLTSLSTAALILFPLNEYIARIRAYETLPLRGAKELRYLAQAYNSMFAANQRHSDHLLYQAEHDPLTGLFNRGAFDDLRRAHQREHIGLMLIDVDNFKRVNDDYGHDTGDRVLKKTADLLSHSFRATDYPCRIGGDEFSVIITDISPSVKGVVQRKIRQVGEGLSRTEDGLPPVTLSVGVAFSDQCGPDQDLYKLADAALYRVKARGRNGCAFYGDDEEPGQESAQDSAQDSADGNKPQAEQMQEAAT